MLTLTHEKKLIKKLKEI